jgi:MFS family permease
LSADSLALRRLPRGIWALGFVSMLMDGSSELVHSLLPVFMASVLGASVVTIGVIEGVAEATASVVKVLSGVISDRLRRRKLLVLIGYGLAAASKPLFPLATSVAWVFVARFVDRVGKGIRGAPRDALIADITPAPVRGAAYGLRQALDSVGAVAGPLMAIVLMGWFADDIKAVLWVAVIPAALAVVLIVAAVREPDHLRTIAPSHSRTAGPSHPSHQSDPSHRIGELPRQFWWVVILGGVFTLARFSEAFLVLRALDVGLAIGYVPAVMIVMNVVYAAAAYPAGRAADRLSVQALLVAGLAALVMADIVLAAAVTPVHVGAGAACWGLHMALSQGLLSKLVADTAGPTLRGTAFGIFNLVSGGALFAASAIAGVLWTAAGPAATFIAGGLFATVATAGLLVYRPYRTV